MPQNNDKKRILIVEDEKNIVQVLAFNIMQAGYAYDIALDGEEGLKKALTGEYDLILLDLMLPKMDGFEVCRRIRQKLSTPVIIVTAREEEVDKILGFDIGADDYVTKPFSIKILLARIKANIRRYSNEMVINDAGVEQDNRIVIRELEIDPDKYQVTNKGVAVDLTKKEYELLFHLASNAGKVFSREELLEQVWGYDGFFGDIRTVDVTVRRLREKLEIDPTKPEYLITKRGVGYLVK
ncbi:MAG: response regulator transcription factor [Clostridia bacterium]|nr:response regulator transcription factor [Clostridia bacterium]MBQ4575360.1 response regulator transcription factor [Clostridia bacterium]